MPRYTLTLLLAISLMPGISAVASDEISRRKAVDHQHKGEQYLRNERYEEAVAEFRQAIALDPLLMLAHYNLGQSYMALKRYPDAVTAYQGCASVVQALSNVGDKEREQRDRENQDEIRELRHSIVQLQTGQFKAASVDAGVLRIEERIRVLEDSRMKGREPVRVPAEVHLSLGSAYFRQNLFDEAERAYLAAVREDRKLGAAHNNLAVIYMLSGRFAEAHAAVAAAESAGFVVPAKFKADLEERQKAARQ